MKNPNLDNKLPDNYIDNDFLTYLEEQGFEVQYIVGDGNCMFRWIADVLVEDQEKHQRYRRLAVQHITYTTRNSKIF